VIGHEVVPNMIAGKHVALRALEREDLKLMHKWLNDEEIMQWARSKPDNTASMESVEKEFEQDLKGENPHRRTFMVIEKKSGKPVGWALIRWWRAFSTTADLGLVIAEKRLRGKGFGTEATSLLVDVAFSQHNMHKAELFTRADNKAAIRAVTKCGFKLEGRHRDEVYFNGKYWDGLTFGLIRNEYGKRTT
jgi:RimJ/RimL family protein N-acetyltransferase